jgi:ribulose-5-phosphate 4-epimerase/fuculose-1-phosphate aldolase
MARSSAAAKPPRASAAERALRREVALANRIIERFGLSRVFGHASARIPDSNRFLLPARRSPAFAEGKRLLILDTEGRVLSGKGMPNSELWIHARIYATRPEVGGIVHAHPPSCICLTQIGEPHRIVHNHGGVFLDGLAQYEHIGLIRSRELGDALASCLGSRLAVMMRGHGITTAARDLRRATVAALYLEESAALQLAMLAASGGDAARLRAYTGEEAERFVDQLAAPMLERAWEYYAAKADGKL